jgi:hypothetical protein
MMLERSSNRVNGPIPNDDGATRMLNAHMAFRQGHDYLLAASVQL